MDPAFQLIFRHILFERAFISQLSNDFFEVFNTKYLVNFSVLSVTAHGAKAAPSPSLGFLGWRRRRRSKGERKRKKGASGMQDGEICQIILPIFDLIFLGRAFLCLENILLGEIMCICENVKSRARLPSCLWNWAKVSYSPAAARFETQKYWLWKRGKREGELFNQGLVGGEDQKKLIWQWRACWEG